MRALKSATWLIRLPLLVCAVTIGATPGLSEEPAVACSERPGSCEFGGTIDDRIMEEARRKAEDQWGEYVRQRDALRDELERESQERKRRNDAKKTPAVKKPQPSDQSLSSCASRSGYVNCVMTCNTNSCNQADCRQECYDAAVANRGACEPVACN